MKRLIPLVMAAVLSYHTYAQDNTDMVDSVSESTDAVTTPLSLGTEFVISDSNYNVPKMNFNSEIVQNLLEKYGFKVRSPDTAVVNGTSFLQDKDYYMIVEKDSANHTYRSLKSLVLLSPEFSYSLLSNLRDGNDTIAYIKKDPYMIEEQVASVIHNAFTSASGVDRKKRRNLDNIMSAYPQPFNSSTTLQFDIPSNSFVNISVYDNLGKRLIDQHGISMSKGLNSHRLDMSGFSSGTYHVVLEGTSPEPYFSVKNILLVK